MFQQKKGVYGSPRMHQELRNQGRKHSIKRVARLMKQAGLSALPKRRKKQTNAQAIREERRANVLKQHFQAAGPDLVWVADITAIRTREGWLYLAGILDLFSRILVGWAIGPCADEELVQTALSRSVAHRHPGTGLLHHSDQGSQYSSAGYQQRLRELGFISSMSRRGNCYDNAPMESFWATLKKECLYREALMSKKQVRQTIFSSVEGFYLHHRRHSALGYLTPAQFEALMT